jgi:hypothetical protein
MEKLFTISNTDITGTDAQCKSRPMLRKSLKGHQIHISTLIAAFFFIVMTASAQGPGASWLYYRVISLSPATPAANFQVKVSLAAGQYTNMKSDGSDLRFYDESNNNCEYWIEKWNNTGASTIWVKVPTSGSDAIVLYYGNASATAASNGSTTFDFFEDFPGTSLGTNWQQNVSNGTVAVSGGIATLTCSTSTGSAYISSAYTPTTTSYLLETKHQEGAYNRNRFYATNSIFGGSPTGFDYGYFSENTTAQSTAKVFWNGYPTSTSLTSNTDYLTQWRLTDGSTYNWYTYTYSTGAAIANGSRTTTVASNMRYITIGVTEASATSTKVDWVRLRQYVATEPVATISGQNSFTTPTNPMAFTSSGYFIVPSGVTSITVQCWGAGGGGSTITSNGRRGGGGGGGAFASSVLAVTPGSVHTITVGTGGVANNDGGSSSFNTTVVVADGGGGAPSNSTTAGTGGTTAASTGTTKYKGGEGAAGGGTFSGGGGGGAGTTGAGGNASNQTGGNGTSLYGGNGGNGVSGGAPGIAGSNFGGGGSGACTNSGTDQTGGSGANGQVIISWCTPPAAPTVVSPVNYCLNATAVPLTATGSNLLWYTTATGGTGSSTAPTPSTSVTGTTSYYVSQTVGCEGPRAQIDVVVYALSTSVLGQTNVSCNGGNDGTITIQAAGGIAPYQFSINNGTTYSPGSNPYTVNSLNASTVYKIRVKDNTGCESPAIP